MKCKTAWTAHKQTFALISILSPQCVICEHMFMCMLCLWVCQADLWISNQPPYADALTVQKQTALPAARGCFSGEIITTHTHTYTHKVWRLMQPHICEDDFHKCKHQKSIALSTARQRFQKCANRCKTTVLLFVVFLSH